MENKSKQRLWRWLFVFLGTALIYSTLYIVRPLCEYLRATTPFNIVVNVIMFGLLFLIIFVTIKFSSVRRKSTLSLLIVAVVAYIFGFIALKIPEEKIHFIEYGILAYLVFRAISLDLKGGPLVYFLSFLLVSLIGWGDEGIQHILPNRYYQTQDVLLNSISGALGLYLTYIVRREREVLR